MERNPLRAGLVEFLCGAAGGPCLCDGGPAVGDTSVNIATVGYTYTMSPNKIYDATYGFTRLGHSVGGTASPTETAYNPAP